jgi:hypothetical protein
MVRVWNAAVNRTYSSALRFLVKSHTLCTLIVYDIVEFIRKGFLFLICLNNCAIVQLNGFQGCATTPSPLYTSS